MSSIHRSELRVDPDEAVTAGGLDAGADEVAAALARALSEAFCRS